MFQSICVAARVCFLRCSEPFPSPACVVRRYFGLTLEEKALFSQAVFFAKAVATFYVMIMLDHDDVLIHEALAVAVLTQVRHGTNDSHHDGFQ